MYVCVHKLLQLQQLTYLSFTDPDSLARISSLWINWSQSGFTHWIFNIPFPTSKERWHKMLSCIIKKLNRSKLGIGILNYLPLSSGLSLSLNSILHSYTRVLFSVMISMNWVPTLVCVKFQIIEVLVLCHTD